MNAIEGSVRVDKDIIINVTPQETRVALLEKKVLTEISIELTNDKRLVGNIYKGRVVRVLPGMQAAFVDLGLERAAFLYVSDVEGSHPPNAGPVPDTFLAEGEDGVIPKPSPLVPIEELLHEGQEILVQVAKDPMGRKGARITQQISLPGRNIVFLPNVEHVGVSRRIEDEVERDRLRELVEGLRSEEGGYIVRTVSEGCGPEEIEREMSFLTRLWKEIERKAKSSSAPNLLHCDLDVTFRSIRDLYNPSVRKIVVDSSDEYLKILDFVDTYVPQAKPVVELYGRNEPIFDFYGIELDISKIFDNRVWLKSGGYIIIEMTEALTAIDVNTGSFVGKRNLEDTILRTNLEAAREIAYQLRLRNIGGIIIIDFIDMESEENREKVFDVLKAEFEGDRARTNLLQISSLGLVEMTRKRVGESLSRSLSEGCPYCEGRGTIRSKTTLVSEIFREIRRKRVTIAGEQVLVRAHPDMVSHLYEEERGALEALESSTGKRIVLEPWDDCHLEEFEIK